MVEIKKEFWDQMSKKGTQEGQLKNELHDLKNFFFDDIILTENVFEKDTHAFTPEFLGLVNKKLNTILNNYDFLTERERERRQNNFTTDLSDDLYMILEKKAFSVIRVSSYKIYNFMKAFSNITDEDMFYIEEDKIYVKLMDPSRICLMEVELKMEGFRFYRKGEVAFNIENLANILKCNKEDKATTELVFGEEVLSVKIVSEKYNSVIERTLEAIDLKKEEIPLDSLYKINYLSEFEMTKEKFEYLLRNLSNDIVQITASQDEVCFSEDNRYGDGKVVWKKENLNGLKFDSSVLKKELGDIGITANNKSIIEKIIEDKQCLSVHSLLFIKYISSMAKVIQAKDSIKFNIRNDNPLRAEIEFKNLGDTKMVFFIAPRVEEVELEENDKEDLEEY